MKMSDSLHPHPLWRQLPNLEADKLSVFDDVATDLLVDCVRLEMT